MDLLVADLAFIDRQPAFPDQPQQPDQARADQPEVLRLRGLRVDSLFGQLRQRPLPGFRLFRRAPW